VLALRALAVLLGAAAGEEIVMRSMLLAFGVIALTAGIGAPAEAQNYPWCAIYNLGEWSSSCSFTTEAQCWASVRGIGGFCMANNTYQPSAPPIWPRRRHQHG
jgi:hypothetical protein